MASLTTAQLVRIANLRDACRSGAARALRVSAGLSLQNVSDTTGIGVATLWRWETGDRQPLATKQALRYADLLDELANRHRPRRRKEVSAG
jgi:DNA-binding transcriptional regulator YiaG